MAGEKIGGTLGVSILTRGGHRFPAGRLGPPSNPPRELAAAARYLIRLQEPSHGLSGENEPQFPIFPAKCGSATSPVLKIGSSQEFRRAESLVLLAFTVSTRDMRSRRIVSAQY